jgi:hypothetical protein
MTIRQSDQYKRDQSDTPVSHTRNRENRKDEPVPRTTGASNLPSTHRNRPHSCRLGVIFWIDLCPHLCPEGAWLLDWNSASFYSLCARNCHRMCCVSCQSSGGHCSAFCNRTLPGKPQPASTTVALGTTFPRNTRQVSFGSRQQFCFPFHHGKLG